MDLSGATPPYVDAVLTSDPGRQGYTFATGYVKVSNSEYTLTADPVTPGVTGTRGFFSDESGVIRAENPAPATVASAPLE